VLGLCKPKSSKRTARILVVDDQRDVVEILRHRLECNGWQVVTAVNGQEGIEKATNEKPDLILLDTMMPVMNGHEMLKCLRGIQDTRGVPVIMCTGCADADDLTQASLYGVAGYVTKPFDLAELTMIVRRVLEDRGFK